MSDNLQATDALRVINLEAKLASQQAAHDAEIAELRKEIAYAERCAVAQTEHAKTALEKLSAANAACAMKDAALKEAVIIIDGALYTGHQLNKTGEAKLSHIREALSITPRQVSEWERKQLEPLRAQVARLTEAFNNLTSEYSRLYYFTDELDTTDMPDAVFVTPYELEITELKISQATAEAFIAECEQRGAVKALEDAANWFILRGPDGTSFDGDDESAEALRKMARDICATSKKAG